LKTSTYTSTLTRLIYQPMPDVAK